MTPTSQGSGALFPGFHRLELISWSLQRRDTCTQTQKNLTGDSMRSSPSARTGDFEWNPGDMAPDP
eukprot:727516-Amorphochlora_amoeboformis.AAC.1